MWGMYVTKFLPVAIPVIWDKRGVTVLALSIFAMRHDLLPPQVSHRQSAAIREENDVRKEENRKKIFRN
jgi:hypothetical protein